MKNLSKYLKHWHYFLISILFFIGLAVLYIMYATPVYKVTATILIQDDKKGDGLLKETAFSDLNMFHTVKNVDNEIQLLKSYNLLERVFKQLSLDSRYYTDGTFRNKEIYGRQVPVKVAISKLYNGAYDSEPKIVILDDSTFTYIADKGERAVTYQFGQLIREAQYECRVFKTSTFKITNKPIYFKFNNLKSMARAYANGKLEIAPVIKDANTISLGVSDAISQRGIDILNTLITAYNQNNVENKSKLALATIQFIDDRIKYLGKDLSTVEQNVAQYKQNNMVTDVNADAQVNLHRADDYSSELGKIDLQLKMLDATESYFNQSVNQSTLVPSTLAIQDGTLSALINRYNSLQLDYQNLLSVNEPNNPLVINAKQQLINLKQSIQENLRNIKKGLQLSYNNLASHTARFESKVKTVPTIERELLQRNRQQEVKENLFAYLVQKREETALSLTAARTDAQVINSPNTGDGPDSPKKPLIILYSFILGFIVPAFIIQGKDHLNKKVQHVSELKLLPSVRILGELSHSKDKMSLVVKKGSRTNISELFKYIRVNLNCDATNDGASRILMVTSSMQGEGKTFVSLNLGATLALTDKNVVLLEFDLRKPDLLKRLKLDNKPGITEYLNSEDTDLSDIIRPSGVAANLWVIGSGKLPQDPSEELLNPKLDQLFETLKKKFDYIIIDTSPVGLVADAFSFERHVDATLYVVRYNYTNKMYLNTIEDIFKNSKLTNPMIVLNDARPENLENYGYASTDYVYSE
jgi:tyrosine-protein kinase Etk/Wzc